MAKPRRKPPARAEIVRVVGTLDDATLAAIAATGASLSEIERAAKRAAGEGEGVARQPLGVAAEAVFDLLSACPEFPKTEPEA
ncbi:MAG: hypothetical protein AB7M05_03910 [Alphaproteobacteria bacterium]